MAVIPRVTGPSVSPQAMPGVSISAPIDQNTERLGAQTSDIADKLGQIRIEEAAKADKAAVVGADTALSSWKAQALYDPQNGALTKQGKNAFDLTNQVLPNYDTQVKSITESLPSQRSKLVFQQAANESRVQLLQQLNQHEAQQRDHFYDQQYADALQQSTDVAALDPTQADAELKKQASLIEVYAGQKGWSDEQKAQALDAAKEKTYTGATQRLAITDPTAALNYLSAHKADIPLQQYEQLQRFALNKQTDAYADGLVASVGDHGPQTATDRLAELKKTLSTEQYADVVTKFDQGMGRLRSQRQTEFANQIASVYGDISTENVSKGTLSNIDALYQKSAFTPLEYASLRSRAEGTYKSQLENSAASATLMQSINDGLPVDPHNTTQMKALSLLFNRDTQAMKPGDDNWQQVALAYANRTTALPKEAQEWTLRAMRSPDPQLAAKASQFVDSVNTTMPNASLFDKDTKARADMINTMVHAGTPVEAAVAHVDDIMKIDERVRDTRNKEYSKLTGPTGTDPGKTLQSLINGDPQLDKWWFSNPTYSDLMRADFDSLSRDYYSLTHDLKQSQQLAMTDLKRNYGVTEINGVKEVSLFPLERYGITRDQVKTELSAFLKDHPQENTTADDLVIVPDAATMKGSLATYNGEGLTPSYVIVNAKTGEQLRDKNGIPQRFALPTNAELTQRIDESRAKANADYQQNLKTAIEERNQNLKAEEERKKIAEGMGYPGAYH